MDGAPATYSKTTQGRELSLRIGDADRTITGAHTYVFRYNVRRAVNFFERRSAGGLLERHRPGMAVRDATRDRAIFPAARRHG